MGHFAMPGLLNDGTDKWQIAIYREEDIIYNEVIDSIARKIEVSRLIGRKVIGQWFGATVSPIWWSYMWLNEGIAMLFTIDFINKSIPESRMLDLFVVQTQQESLYLDDKEIMNPLTTDLNSTSEINSLFSFTYYLKAPVILRMLQLSLGNEVFQKGIDIYLKRQSGTPDDFWAAMQSVYYEEQALRPKKFNITKIMDPWTKQKHYPVINVTRSLDQTVLVISRNDTESETRSTPLTFTRQTYIDFKNTSFKKWLRPDKLAIYPVFMDEWVIINLQQSGYYRVTYDTNNWRKIAQYLDSEIYTKIHVLNRAQIIDDAFHFMMSGKLSCPIFWELTSYLSRETDYIAWYPMIKVIERISHIFPFPQSKQLKIKILSRLNPLLQKIGYDNDPNNNDLTISLRQEAIKWACVLDDPHCKSVANIKLETHLTNPTLNKVLPWKEWTFCNGLKAMGYTFIREFEFYVEEYLDGNVKNLEFLACSEYFNIEPMNIERIKAKCYSGDSIEKNKPCIKSYNRFFHRFIARHAKNDSVLDYILANLKKIKPEEISTRVALTNIINHVYSWKQLDKIKEFVKNMEKLSSVKININHEYHSSLSEVLFTTKAKMDKLIQNNLKLLVSAIQNKISIRLSEIERHVSYIPMCA